MADPTDRGLEILSALAEIGRKNPAQPEVGSIEPFKGYLSGECLQEDLLDRRDGGVTRREAIVRFLLLSAVVDQGPDIPGVRELTSRVTNDLYEKEIRIFHRPLDFFAALNISIDRVHNTHELVKRCRAEDWAKRNDSSPERYLLYMDKAGQTLGYVVSRWGPPIGLALVLERDAPSSVRDSSVALCEHLKSWASAEEMTTQLKDHPRYGLGKAIGDKAANLFGKWVTYSYPLLRSSTDPGWGQWSFELPFDSNAGRVLYRTGFLNLWATTQEYEAAEVLQRDKGKKGTIYLRVTNIRGLGSTVAANIEKIALAHKVLSTKHLKTNKLPPKKVQIQRIPSALSLMHGRNLPGEIDDGLIKVGTTWCLNIAEPLCNSCPLRPVCDGAMRNRALITDVRT